MYALLQDWIDIEGNGEPPISQSAAGWLDLSGYQDVTFWFEMKASLLNEVELFYETAPAIDPTLFKSMVSFVPNNTMLSVPQRTSVRLSSNPAVPLAGLVRWRLQCAVPNAPWRMTFRIHCVADRPRGATGQMPPMVPRRS